MWEEKRNDKLRSISKLVLKKIIKEDNEMIYGISYNKQTELVDDVIMRIKEYGEEYMNELNALNFNYPTKKYKRSFPIFSVLPGEWLMD